MWVRINLDRGNADAPVHAIYQSATPPLYQDGWIVIDEEYAIVKIPLEQVLAVFEYKAGYAPRGATRNREAAEPEPAEAE